jgi:hypothetical protein
MKKLRPGHIAAAATLILWAWQAVLVHGYFGGDWTALFHAGDKHAAAQTGRPVYIHKNSDGYDGQWYRIVAHDPLLSHSPALPLDDHQLRYRRILLPAAAHLLAAGNPRFIDTAYLGAILLAVFLTAAFAAAWLPAMSLSPYWALLVPLLPGMLVCAARLTVDAALYAAIAAALLAYQRGRRVLLWLALAAAPLARDLGFLLPAAFALHALLGRRWRQAATYATAALPAVLWYIALRSLLPPQPAEVLPAWTLLEFPLESHLHALYRIHPYDMPRAQALFTHILDRLLMLAAFAAAALSLWRLRRPAREPLHPLLGLFAGVYLLSGNLHFWRDIFSIARLYTPIFALLAADASYGRAAVRTLPLAVLSLRILWEFEPLTLISLKNLLGLS